MAESDSPSSPTSPTSAEATAAGAGGRRLKYNLQMDLMLLRQIRAHAGNPFVSGSEAYEEACRDLLSSEPKMFEGLTKKGARDRAMKLLDHHGKGDAWKKKQ